MGGDNLIVLIHLDVQSGSNILHGDHISRVEDANGVRLQRVCHGVRVRLADQLLLHELGFFFAGGWVGEGGLESGQRKEARKGELHGDQGSDLDD